MDSEDGKKKDPIDEETPLFPQEDDSEEDKKSHENKIFTIFEEKHVVEKLKKFLEKGRPTQKRAIDAVCRKLGEIHLELKEKQRTFPPKFAYKVINSDPELWAKYFGDKKRKGKTSEESVSYGQFNELRTLVDILENKIHDLEDKISKLNQRLADSKGNISSASLDSEQLSMSGHPTEYLCFSSEIPNPKSPSTFFK